jgi:hypothetical protein
LVRTLFGDDLLGDGGAELKLRTAGKSKQLHEFSREELPALALVAVVTASIAMARAVGDQQFLLSTQPRPVQLGDWYHGTRHRSRQKRDIRRHQVDRTLFLEKRCLESGDHAFGSGDNRSVNLGVTRPPSLVRRNFVYQYGSCEDNHELRFA